MSLPKLQDFLPVPAQKRRSGTAVAQDGLQRVGRVGVGRTPVLGLAENPVVDAAVLLRGSLPVNTV